MSPSEVPPSSGPVGSLPWANDPTQIQGKPVPPAPSSHRICEDPSPGWERYWLRGSEAINPIVVKEVRQSLKSRQFTLSFGLTLLAAVSWTLIGTTLMVPRLYYLPAGLPFLTGFFCILALPLLIIVPFSAYRSLSAEMEHSTFELLKISALSALQIVYGKMASALVQTMLYLSALAPCIVLTYLLRGVSLWSILLLLGATVVISVVETAIAILLAAISNTRVLQSLISLVTLIAMICIFFSWVSFVVNTLVAHWPFWAL